MRHFPVKIANSGGLCGMDGSKTGGEKKGLKTRVRRVCVAEVVVAVSLVVSTNEVGCIKEKDIVHLQASHT